MTILNALLAAMLLVLSFGPQPPRAVTAPQATSSPAVDFGTWLRGQDKSSSGTGYTAGHIPCPLCNPYVPCRCIPGSP
jgi:hypothetical protein